MCKHASRSGIVVRVNIMDATTNMEDGSISLRIPREEFLLQKTEMMVLEKAAQSIADEFVKQNMPSILARIDQQAIANLAIADGANAIKDMLDKKLPDRVDTIVKKEVYQRGIFGGVRRVA